MFLILECQPITTLIRCYRLLSGLKQKQERCGFSQQEFDIPSGLAQNGKSHWTVSTLKKKPTITHFKTLYCLQNPQKLSFLKPKKYCQARAMSTRRRPFTNDVKSPCGHYSVIVLIDGLSVYFGIGPLCIGICRRTATIQDDQFLF